MLPQLLDLNTPHNRPIRIPASALQKTNLPKPRPLTSRNSTLVASTHLRNAMRIITQHNIPVHIAPRPQHIPSRIHVPEPLAQPRAIHLEQPPVRFHGSEIAHAPRPHRPVRHARQRRVRRAALQAYQVEVPHHRRMHARQQRVLRVKVRAPQPGLTAACDTRGLVRGAVEVDRVPRDVVHAADPEVEVRRRVRVEHVLDARRRDARVGVDPLGLEPDEQGAALLQGARVRCGCGGGDFGAQGGRERDVRLEYALLVGGRPAGGCFVGIQVLGGAGDVLGQRDEGHFLGFEGVRYYFAEGVDCVVAELPAVAVVRVRHCDEVQAVLGEVRCVVARCVVAGDCDAGSTTSERCVGGSRFLRTRGPCVGVDERALSCSLDRTLEVAGASVRRTCRVGNHRTKWLRENEYARAAPQLRGCDAHKRPAGAGVACFRCRAEATSRKKANQ